MSDVYMICVLAKDAADGDEHRACYTDVGLDFKLRVLSLRYPSSFYHYAHDKAVVLFGAGTDQAHAGGPTLAALGQEFMRKVYPKHVCLANTSEHNYYGTLEEMFWMVRAAAAGPWKRQDVRFVFYTQRRHMRRVRFIWWLFYQDEWGEAEFVVTPHVKQIPWIHELGGIWKAWQVYRGKAKPRYATPYPTVGRSKIEC